jgi:vanillate O-demethylase ferredoxin subunit
MVRQLVETGQDFVLHYCMRSRETAPLVTELEEICGAKLRRWISEEGTRLDVATLLSAEGNSELYVCGPLNLISAVEDAALHASWPEERLHMERFTALANGDFEPKPFDVVIASSGKEFAVPADRSLLSVLNENGFAIHSTCETGVCGTCECEYIEGTVQHRDVVLSPQKQKSKLMPCVSRGNGKLVLGL